MNWPLTVVLVLAALGAVGFCLMLATLVLIARQGGWQKAIQQPIADRQWTLPRRLLVAGASLGMLFGIGIVVLNMIPGGIPWRNPPVSDSSPSAPPSVVKSRPDESRPLSSDASGFTEQPAPDFDPKLTLAWPDTPEESRRRINAGLPDETTIYSATFSQSQSSPVTIFSASVYEFTENELQGSDPKELVASHLSVDDEVELTRKNIEHGPKKLLGSDATAKDDAGFVRRVNVMAGRRIYSIQVNSLKQERLGEDDVTRFFDSIAIKN